jgi:predicted  nucleic acid-binding Zn-ribbon protein
MSAFIESDWFVVLVAFLLMGIFLWYWVYTDNTRGVVKFKCPRCGGKAYKYSRILAGCMNCGSLLYTEIPQDKEQK